MAHMIPSDIPSTGPGAHAERVLFEALRGSLSDEFFVYSRLQFLGDGAREGEVDFLVVHRERGMLLVECKGGGVTRRRDGTWIRCVDGRDEIMKKSPWEQARASLHELRGELLRRLNRLYAGRFLELPFVFGDVVAFPLSECASSELLPLDAPRETLWDAATLPRLGPAVEETFRFWRGGRTVIPLSESEFKNFRRNALQPVLQLVPTLGAKLAAEGEQIRRLSEQQARVFAGIAGNRRARVIGGAGTGKTLLARELVRELAGQGERVLLACFNRNLAAHLRDDLAAEKITGATPSVRHFHGLCRDAFLALGRDLAFPSRDDAETSRRFWDEDAPLVLLEALMSGAMPRFDAIVVDEAQDFLPDWWAILEDLLADESAGKIFAFLDPRQAIFGRPSAVPAFETVFRLTHNYRNTRRIAETLAALTGDPTACPPGTPLGEDVVVHPQESREDALRELENLIGTLTARERVAPDQIALLTPHTKRNSVLAGVESLAGIDISTDPRDRDGMLLHTTFGAFKGLESDVVILLDVDTADVRCARGARMVAASRARQVLHVFAKNDWLGGDAG